MKKKLNLILLVDDFDGANFLHQKVINEAGCAERVQIETDAEAALEFLATEVNGDFPHPELIFIDLNMPSMNGWEFLDDYKKLSREQRWGTLIVILTTSHNPDDLARAKAKHPATVFLNKPLLQSSLHEVLKEHFQDNF
jgi:CheY-like chemotaxis protein